MSATLKSSKLSALASAVIHDTGRFKYVLIRVKDPNTQESMHVVRGHPRFPFHADIYDDCTASWLGQGLVPECLGGGRIEWTTPGSAVCVYGYSQGFGKADHEKARSAILQSYPSLSVAVDNDPARY